MDQITHDVRRNSWLKIIEQCQARPENITVKQWLADNGIKDKAYYYWLRKFRKEAYANIQLPSVSSTASEVTFAELQLPINDQSIPVKCSENSTIAIIKCNGISFEISNEISVPLSEEAV